MKTVELKTNRGDFLAIDLDTLTAEDKKRIFVNKANNFHGVIHDDEMYEEVGFYEDLTDEQKESIVHDLGGIGIGFGKYKRYFRKGGFQIAALSIHYTDSLEESFDSLLYANRIEPKNDDGSWMFYKKIQ